MKIDLHRICKIALPGRGVFWGEEDENPKGLPGDGQFQDGEDPRYPSFRHGKPAVSTDDSKDTED